MPYKTRVSYIDADGCQCKQQSNTFNAQTSLTDIHLWISTWFDDTYKLQIQDPDDGEWIDFDQGFFNQQNPYNSQPVINLKILQNSSNIYSIIFGVFIYKYYLCFSRSIWKSNYTYTHYSSR
jgi:hypothetical protein